MRLIPVTGLARRPARSPGPSLQGHYNPFVTTTPRAAPVRRIRYSRLRLSSFGVLPFPLSSAGRRHDWFPSSAQEPAPCSCPLYAGHHLARSETCPPSSSQSIPSTLVLMSSIIVSTRHRKVRSRSSSWCTPDGGSPAFSAPLKTPALNGRPVQRFVTPLSQGRSRRASEPRPVPPSLVQHRVRHGVDTPRPPRSWHTRNADAERSER